MTSDAKIKANRENAQHSTGPITEAGKGRSSRNHLTWGLYSREDYVKKDEIDLYKEFCTTLYNELTPATLLEEAFTTEIIGATWRLRRCSAAEADLADYSEIDPILDETKQKQIRSIERARASAQTALNKALNQLRKLQTERLLRNEINFGTAGEDRELDPLADSHKINNAAHREANAKKRTAQQTIDETINAMAAQAMAECNPMDSAPDWSGLIPTEAGSETQSSGQLASNCTDAEEEPFTPTPEFTEFMEMADALYQKHCVTPRKTDPNPEQEAA